ncbi:hypothetical protein GCM10007416_30480 [Kroppenstedtia guangzhouensis]|uniref:Myb-like domain-containing protein n=1 Tax=Kroppenstedtia guangzhouensis TaxID=1274356 RepID=A0ABQ1H148_9BACL|nr:hypothetical protein GCM10007416_30480 [Kroppenstedtia guangzhouensis]
MQDVSRPWNPKEDRFLLSILDDGRELGMSRNQSFAKAAMKLRRSPRACLTRWKALTVRDKSTVTVRANRPDFPHLRDRIRQLEQKLDTNQTQMRELIKENRRMREEMKFFEIMLLEEYQLLISLLEKKQNSARLHHF